jgi:HSP20 family molecular chaperone IbpA
MKRVDIDYHDGNVIVTFEMPNVREQDILVTVEDTSIRVIASTKKAEAKHDEKGNLDIDINSVYFDKIVVLGDESLDFLNMKQTFFLGWLEIIIPIKK